SAALPAVDKSVKNPVEQKMYKYQRQGQQNHHPQSAEQEYHGDRRDDKPDECAEQQPCDGPAPVRQCNGTAIRSHIDAATLTWCHSKERKACRSAGGPDERRDSCSCWRIYWQPRIPTGRGL